MFDFFDDHHKAFAQFWSREKDNQEALALLAFVLAAYEAGHTALHWNRAENLWNQYCRGENRLPRLESLPVSLFQDETSPLVLLKTTVGPVLALRKAYTREKEIKECVTILANQSPPWRSSEVNEKAPGWSRLNDEQKHAVGQALRGAFFALTGGPGTGKTSTIFQLLLQVLDRNPQLRIALATPTGRAAARMAESLFQEAAHSLEASWQQTACCLIPQTLHRLLGIRSDLRGAFHNKKNPLPYDLVIVDEFSMVDVRLCRDLLRALKPSTALILVGDSAQLPSIEPGCVLPDILALDRVKERTVSLTINQRVQRGSKSAVILDQLFHIVLDSQTTGLEKVNVLQSLQSPGHFIWHENAQRFVQDFLAAWIPYGGLAHWNRLCHLGQSNKQLPELLNIFQKTIILTPFREGVWGSLALNRLIKKAILAPWEVYAGLPWLIKRNIPSLRLANGDRGLCVLEKNRLYVAFADNNKPPRLVPFALVSEDGEPSWAMTVHKSQGSEFQRVFLVIGEPQKATRQLLYTGMTRARQEVRLYASLTTVKEVVEKTLDRQSLLSLLQQEYCLKDESLSLEKSCDIQHQNS